MSRQVNGFFFATAVVFSVVALATSFAFAQTEEDVDFFPPTLVNAPGRDVRGSVVDQQGQPIKDAKVTIFSFVYGADKAVYTGDREWDLLRARQQPIKQVVSTQTDSGGEFLVAAADTLWPIMVYVYHPDYAVSLTRIGSQDLEIVLADGVTATGRIVDNKGMPLANVEVQSFGGWLESIDCGDDRHFATTNADGRFELPHCPINDSLHRPHLRFQRPGLVHAKVIWFPNETAASNFGKNMPRDQFQIGDFECTMLPVATFELVGIDDETDVRVQPGFLNVMPVDMGNLISRIEGKQKDFRFEIKPGEYELVCIPKANSGLLGKRIKVAIEKSGPVEKQIRFSKGCLISGTVIDSKTTLPIAAVPVAWIPDAGQSLLADGTRFHSFVRTDEAGKFSISVPPGKGKLTMVGRVPGYVTVAADFEGNLPAAIDNVFSQSIDPKVGESSDDIEFKLAPSRVVQGQVLNESGEPVSAVAYFGSYFHSSYSGHPANRGVTDDEGNFTITEMFDDATLSYGGLDERQHRGGELMICRVAVIDVESNHCALVEMDSSERVGDPIDLQVNLAPAAIVTGRVLDSSTGRPVANARVTARLSGIAGLDNVVWDTSTNIRGQYRLQGLLPDVQLKLKTETSQNGLVIKSENLKIQSPASGGELASDIRLAIPGSLVVDKPAFKIGGSEPDKAIQMVTEFVQKQMGKVDTPARLSGSSSDDPDNQFRNKVLATIGPLVGEFLALELTPEQESALYVGILEPIARNSRTWIPNQGGWLNDAVKKLSTSLIDQDGVFPVLRSILQHGVYGSNFAKIEQSTSKPEIKAWATVNLAESSRFRLLTGGSRMSDEQFAKALADYDGILAKCMGEFADEPWQGSTIGQSIERNIKQYLESGRGLGKRLNEDRKKQVMDMLRKHLKGDSF